ncbi:redox-regulated ATPase YchF [Candidatus Peregrinibacteria bacterium CG10_big_fil_rev_8_21_14_0_10_55_24]|nr:MAG: redox-regulated ATPase YchF [Candidatus Peregrinibacteria bacterium CG10_big_fil_rev_8_21_14_0_10_55_24]
MALRMGIVGLPNVGKSTLFNALTRTRAAQASNFPFCTIDPNVGIVEVPDVRLDRLAAIVHPQKIIPATVEFLDIAGLVKDAHKGEGLGNQFLGSIREAEALCHIVRFFPGESIMHVEGSVDPKRDRETIETELILADLQSVEKRLDRARSAAKTGDKEKVRELAVAEKLKAALDTGKLAQSVTLTEEEDSAARSFFLLTRKPLLYALNVSEEQLKELSEERARQILGIEDDAPVILVCAKVEEELQDLSPEEGTEYLSGLGLTSSGLDRLIHAAYRALGYITFFTAGPKEVRAWTVRRGAKAPQAAGVIHTDFERGFIRAETIAYEDYVQLSGEQGAKAAGKARSEGKEYVVQDGDVMLFKFNV